MGRTTKKSGEEGRVVSEPNTLSRAEVERILKHPVTGISFYPWAGTHLIDRFTADQLGRLAQEFAWVAKPKCGSQATPAHPINDQEIAEVLASPVLALVREM